MQRWLAVLVGLALLLAVPATASAAKATRYTDHYVTISCDGPATTGGGFAFFSATASDAFGPDAYLDFWASGTPDGPSDLSRDFDAPLTVSWDGTTLAGSIPLLDTDGDPAGSATFSATLAPVDDPYTFDDRFRDGNRWFDVTGVAQPMDPSGTLVVGSSTFSLGACFAEEATVTVFATNPTSYVSQFSDRTVGCELSTTAGDIGFLFVGLGDTEVFVDATVFPAGSGSEIAAFGSGTLVGGVLDATLDLFDPHTGEPVPGTGSIHLVVAGGGEPIDYVLRDGGSRLMVRGTTIDIEGSLTVGSITFDLGACIGLDVRSKRIETRSNGPKPGGKVPANDLPTGAKTLTVGSRTSVATKGASPDREASFECMVFDDGSGSFEIPVGHTVWYRIVGTGGPITVDTAGSDYDTVVAVYTADGSGGYTPVPDACVDDVALEPIGRTLQSAVTWDSVAGTVYYVQIGGFPNGISTFGNLRVAVR